jgi:peptidoglycan-associated lipoprotein
MRTSRIHVFLIAAVALVGSFALTGCPKKKVKTPACESSEDCKDGLACINKVCQVCKADVDCGDGMACQKGQCVAKPECSTDDDCGAGKVCKANKCQACGGDSECGPGGKCQAGACQRPKACKADDECAEDEDCVNGRCLPGGPPPVTDTTCALSTIYFAYDASAIAGVERDHLDANGGCLEKEAAKNVYVIGHTDDSGTDEYNIALSERRARAVADYLARLGVDPARLQIVPKGETSPTGEGADKDRRVEMQWR